MFKTLYISLISGLMFSYAAATELADSSDDNIEISSRSDKGDETDPKNESFLNIKAAHERSNEHAFGGKNTSAIALNPVIFLFSEQVVLEGDLYYGRQFSLNGFITSAEYWGSVFNDQEELYENFGVHKKSLTKATENSCKRPHFYRNYTRCTYKNNDNEFRIVVGDTTTRNTIGFQQAMSGAGISIFRQSGNGKIINGGSPIVITRISKIEYQLNGKVIAFRILKPGIYTLDDLVEEAKLPGIQIKISDQLSRSEILKVEYFSGYGMLDAGKDDFDITVLYPHIWNLEDPMRTRYKKKHRYSANYRYGYTDRLTLGVGGQAYDDSYILDVTAIYSGFLGKIAPNAAFSLDSRAGRQTRKTGGIGLFYALPENEKGIFLEASVGFKGRGFGSLGASEDQEEAENAFIDTYFPTAAVNRKFKKSSRSSSIQQVTIRVYSEPIRGITPTFVFNGEWHNSGENQALDKKLREYTISLSGKAYERYNYAVSVGITYDDPAAGKHRGAIRKRLTMSCSYALSPEVELQTDYTQNGAEQRRWHSGCTITGDDGEGNQYELTSEMFGRPGMRNPVFALKYDTKYLGLKLDQSTTNNYEDKGAAKTASSHTNRQRALLGTSISQRGFRAYKKGGFNTLR
ncbi:MAG: hypothetical protein LBB25_03350 [Holosporaceae bacterium]|nr:hypothetical protein [Holosporaceae bacterium]